jgi:uncharacterized protein (DUF927 family)
VDGFFPTNEATLSLVPPLPPPDGPMAAPAVSLASWSIPTEPSGPAAAHVVDELIAAGVHDIQADWPASQLDNHLRSLCEALVEAGASDVVRNHGLAQLNEKLKELNLPKVPKSNWKKLLQDAKATLAINQPQTGGANAEAGVAVRDVLPDAPVPEGTVVPPGWKVLDHGVFRAAKDLDLEILPTPVVLTERLLDDATGTETVRLAWRRDGQWKERSVPREVLAAKRDIVGLAGFGLPITSGNASPTIDYLAKFEAANLEVLPRTQVRHQMGWIDDSLTAFLWGRTVLRATTPTEDSGQASPSALDVRFQGADVGDEQVANGFRAAGTYESWKVAAEPALAFPRVRLAVTAGLAAPLLALLQDEDARNFGLDVCGETSKGKTTTLRLAASCWGCPDERAAGGSALTSWNATRVGSERWAGLVSDLPLIKDDTRLARKAEDVSKLLYDVAMGRTSDRGTVKGLDRTRAFRTILLTSGESRACSFSGDGGTRARVLTLWGVPFERADPATAELVNRLNAEILRNYGHAGPQFVRYVLQHRDCWPAWRKQYREVKEAYLVRAEGNAVVGRLADALGTLTLAGTLAAEALDLPVLAHSPISELWSVLTAEAAEADRATQALLHVTDWATANQDQFFGRREKDNGRPQQGWAGRWDGRESGPFCWPYLGFLPDRLHRILADAGYDYDAVVSTWYDRGWLRVDPSDKAKRHYQATLDGQKSRLVALKEEALRQAGWHKKEEPASVAACEAGHRFVTTALCLQGGDDAVERTEAVHAVGRWLGVQARSARKTAAPSPAPPPAGESGNEPSVAT